jgi:predicted flap endonuclease-1-like 5' DNA nuclease
MQMLFLQTLGLMLGAYFLGAFFGCLLRRVFFAGRPVEEPVAVVEAPVEAPTVAASQRFEEALRGPVTTAEAARAVVAPLLPAAGGSSGQGSVAAMVVTPEPSDDLTLIRGIDDTIRSRLASQGISKFAEIAAWRADDVGRIATAIGLAGRGRIAAENWIEQAQVLAKGGLTRYAKERAGKIALAQPTEDEGTPKPIAAAPAATPAPVATAPTSPRVEERAAFAVEPRKAAAASVSPADSVAAAAAVLAEAAAAVARSTAAPANGGGKRDDLKRIAGITAEIEKLLNVQGVTRFADIAGWRASDIARFDRLLGRDGRIRGENWVEQAQILARGGETAFSRERDRQADTIRPTRVNDAIGAPADGGSAARISDDGGAGSRIEVRPDLAMLRSVKSEAYGGQGAYSVDDLKRIRGIGVLIERRLATLGVTSYEQIANWSDVDIDRISNSLDFKGRIERENWVEQARILASGGQTEFSRRVDRGEVETSRQRTE